MFMKIGYGVHGCLSSCPICKQGCPICHPCDQSKHGGLARGVEIKPLTHPKPQKCDLCGSTAIDHTEMHCQMNRMTQRLSQQDTRSTQKPTKSDLKNATTEATQERKESSNE